ncbi:MAG: hypothetical protein ACJ8AH_04045 [Stellaceae bacterium]
MIDVHRSEAASLVRENGRAAALAGQATRATSRIKVLGMIQRQQAGRTSFIPTRRFSFRSVDRKNEKHLFRN